MMGVLSIYKMRKVKEKPSKSARVFVPSIVFMVLFLLSHIIPSMEITAILISSNIINGTDLN